MSLKCKIRILFSVCHFSILACNGSPTSPPDDEPEVVLTSLYWEIAGGITEGADLRIKVGQQAKMVAVFNARPAGSFIFNVYETDRSGGQLVTDTTVPRHSSLSEIVSASNTNVEQDRDRYKLSVSWTAVFHVGREILTPDLAEYYFILEQDGQVLGNMLENANKLTDNKLAPLLEVESSTTVIGLSEKKDRIVEVLFNLNSGLADMQTRHDYNDYGNCPPIFNCNKMTGTGGYRGGHAGWDVRTLYEEDKKLRNATFYSLTAGIVVNVSALNTIAIYDPDSDKTTVYLHASEVDQSIRRKANATPQGSVRVGDTLGKQGEKGFATAPHVHIEVREGMTRLGSSGAGATDSAAIAHASIDPIDYLYKAVQVAK